jgi:uncharacterized protein
VLALGRAGVIEICTSLPILEEIEGVLIRKFGWTAPRAHEAVRAIRDFARLVNPGEPVDVVADDEPDNRIVECAIAAGAEAIVTGDRHLLKLRRFRNIRVVTLREFLGAT